MNIQQKVLIPIAFLSGMICCFTFSLLLRQAENPFPTIADKYKYPALMTAKQFLERFKIKGQYPTHAAPTTLIICCDDLFLEAILRKNPNQQCDGCFPEVHFLTDQPSAAIAKFGWTSPLNALKLDMAIAWGVKQVIFIGTCCGLQENVALGDLLVCQKAIRDEGVSHHYLPPSPFVYPSRTMQESS